MVRMIKATLRRAMSRYPDLFRPIWSVIYPLYNRRTIDEGLAYSDRSSAFSDIFRDNRWGSAESVSGTGSTLAHSLPLRKRLPKLLAELQVTSFLDAPCGDHHWISTVEFPKQMTYVGGDIVPELIARNETRHGASNKQFRHLDIVADDLPDCDLWLCRHVLFHLSNDDIIKVFENFARSNIKYILMEDHTFVNNNNDIRSGGFRLVNVRAHPFFLPKPTRRVPDSVPPEAPGYLGLWTRDQVAKALADRRELQV